MSKALKSAALRLLEHHDAGCGQPEAMHSYSKNHKFQDYYCPSAEKLRRALAGDTENKAVRAINVGRPGERWLRRREEQG